MRFDNSSRLILLRTTFVLNDVQIRLAPELLEYARYLESADSLQCTQKSVVCLPLSILRDRLRYLNAFLLYVPLLNSIWMAQVPVP